MYAPLTSLILFSSPQPTAYRLPPTAYRPKGTYSHHLTNSSPVYLASLWLTMASNQSILTPTTPSPRGIKSSLLLRKLDQVKLIGTTLVCVESTPLRRSPYNQSVFLLLLNHLSCH